MIEGSRVNGQVAGLQVRFQRNARARRVIDGESRANRFGRVTRFHARPIHAFCEQIVTIFSAYLRHMLVPSARFQL